MALIGTRLNAQTILDYKEACNVAEWNAQPDEPQGWRCVGSGSFREAWLHEPSEVIYKVSTYDEDSDYGSPSEHRKARALYRQAPGGRLTPWLRIPKTSLFTFEAGVILAMEFVQGEQIRWPGGSDIGRQGRLDLFNLCRFEDMHGYNFIVEATGVVVPIDLGSRRVSKWSADLRVLAGLDDEQNEQHALRQAHWRY